MSIQNIAYPVMDKVPQYRVVSEHELKSCLLPGKSQIRKKRYPTKERADLACKEAYQHWKGEWNSYLCQYCLFWHIGHRRNRNPNPILLRK